MKMRNFLTLVLASILSVFSSRSMATNPQVTLHITGAVTGEIVLELYADEAPITTENFIQYVQSGFYDGLIFHRVISGFMIQGGGFDTNMVKKTPGDSIINESSNRLSNIRGTIAMARTPLADSATSEFFINHADNTGLNYGALTYDYQYNVIAQVGYCVFGHVVSGMNVIDAIAAVTTETLYDENDNPMYYNVPVDDVMIQSAEITLNVPLCSEKLEGDVDGDCDVDFADFSAIAENWLQCNAINTDCQ